MCMPGMHAYPACTLTQKLCVRHCTNGAPTLLSSTAGSSWMPSSASRSAMVVLIFSSVLLPEAVEVVPSVPVALESIRCGSLPPGLSSAGNRVLWPGDAATAGRALHAAACMRGRWCVTAPNALHGNIWAGWAQHLLRQPEKPPLCCCSDSTRSLRESRKQAIAGETHVQDAGQTRSRRFGTQVDCWLGAVVVV